MTSVVSVALLDRWLWSPTKVLVQRDMPLTVALLAATTPGNRRRRHACLAKPHLMMSFKDARMEASR